MSPKRTTRGRLHAGQKGQRPLRHLARGVDRLAAVVVALGEAAADTQHGAFLRLLHRASQQILQGATPAKRRAGPALGLETANDLAQIGGGVAHGAAQTVSGAGRAA